MMREYSINDWIQQQNNGSAIRYGPLRSVKVHSKQNKSVLKYNTIK